MTSPSVLVIGATGATVKHIPQMAAKNPRRPRLHAFVRNPAKLTDEEKQSYTSVIQGDATNSQDMKRAFEQSNPDYLILGLGLPNLYKQDLRERNAKALVEIMGPGSKFEKVKTLVISAAGTNGSALNYGFGMGTATLWILRNIFDDHDKQEQILAPLNTPENKRMLFLRPTFLSSGNPTGKTVLFGEQEKAPTMKIDRQDLAKFIVDQICGDNQLFGQAVSITGPK